MHTNARIYHKLSFLRLLCWRSREYPFFRGRVECYLVFLLELVYVFGKVPCLASGTSLLSFSLFMGPVLKFHSVGTPLMRNFDLYFSERWSLLFPDTCLTQRRLSEPYFSTWSQDFLHRVCRGLFASFRNQRIRVFRDATQLWYNFHSSHSVLVVAFSSFLGIVAILWLFVWLLINLMMREQTLIPGFASRFCFVTLNWHSGGCQYFRRRSRASTFQMISARLSKNGTMVTCCLGYFFSSIHFDLVTRMAQKVWRHCALVFVHDRYSLAGNSFFFPLVTNTFSSFNAIHSFTIFDQCACFNCPVSGVKAS